MKKYLLVFCFFFFYKIAFTQTYFQEITQANKWKEIISIDKSVSNLLTTSPIFPSQKIPIYIYKPNFQQLINSSNKILKPKEFIFPNNIKLKKDSKLISYITQINNGNFAEILPILEKKASSNNIKTQLIALWVAQIYYLQNKFNKAQDFLLFSYLSSNNKIALQSEYLQALIYFQNKNYDKIKLQIKNWSLTYPNTPLLTKINSLQFYIKIKEKNYEKILQEAVNWGNYEEIDIALLKAILYYNLHQFSRSAFFLQKVNFTNYSKNQQVELHYLDLWLALFNHSKNYKQKKQLFTKNFLSKKNDWDYLLFLENFFSNKTNYKTAKKLSNSILRTTALLLLEEKKLLTKEEKKEFLEENIILKNSPTTYYYNIKRSHYWQSKNNYYQALNEILNAQYQAGFFPIYFQKPHFEKLNITLGIVYAKQNKIEKAQEIFANWDNQSSYYPLANYYLADTYYRQKNLQKLADLPYNFKIPKEKIANYLSLKAWTNYLLGKKELAIQQLKKDKNTISKSLLYAIYFDQGKYKKIITSFYPTKKNNYNLDKFYILALLKTQNNTLALQYLEKNKLLENPLYHQLYWEVLLANSQQQKTINAIKKTIKNNKKSIITSAYLAKVFFLLKNYNESLQHLQDTIILGQRTAAIDYNIFLNFVYSSNKNIFQSLENEKDLNILYQKTLVVSNILEQRLLWKTALKAYQNYLKNSDYKKTTIQLLVQRNFLYQSLDNFCLKYGEKPFPQESEEEKQDRQILNIYCARAIKIDYPIEPNFFIRKNKQYRVSSWNLLFFLSTKQEPQLVSTKNLNPLEKQEYFLFLAQEELTKKNYNNVFQILKQAENLTLTAKNEQQIYLLKAQTYLLQEKNDNAINYFIKLLYSPIQEKTQVLLILEIIPIMLEKNWYQEAEKLFRQIKEKNIPQELKLQYFQTGQKLLLIKDS